MAKKQYVWFLEPLDDRTNEIIGKALGEAAEESFARIKLSDDKEHKLWRCPAKLVADFSRSRTQLGLCFLVYNCLGNGKIRPCPLFLWRRQRHCKSPPRKQTVPQ